MNVKNIHHLIFMRLGMNNNTGHFVFLYFNSVINSTNTNHAVYEKWKITIASIKESLCFRLNNTGIEKD
jgi:hypothetical protein